MGLQQFTGMSIALRERVNGGKPTEKCPRCNEKRNTFFRNMMGTLECMCGIKFYND